MKESFAGKIKALFSKGKQIDGDFFEDLTDMLVEGDIGDSSAVDALAIDHQFVIIDEHDCIEFVAACGIEEHHCLGLSMLGDIVIDSSGFSIGMR